MREKGELREAVCLNHTGEKGELVVIREKICLIPVRPKEKWAGI